MRWRNRLRWIWCHSEIFQVRQLVDSSSNSSMDYQEFVELSMNECMECWRCTLTDCVKEMILHASISKWCHIDNIFKFFPFWFNSADWFVKCHVLSTWRHVSASLTVWQRWLEHATFCCVEFILHDGTRCFMGHLFRCVAPRPVCSIFYCCRSLLIFWFLNKNNYGIHK